MRLRTLCRYLFGLAILANLVSTPVAAAETPLTTTDVDAESSSRVRPAPPAEAEGRLDLIEKRGRLIVGVKADYAPWGMVDENGTLVGMEADLAADVARALGVDLELVPVTTSNRLQKLEDGAVDLVIATMGDTPKRRELSGLLLPHYYASGVDILTHKDTPFTSWGQLRGRSICLTAGAYYNRTIISRYLIDPVVFKGTRDTQLGLRDGRCVGWAYDNTSLARLLKKPTWADYSMPLPTILSTPWAVAVRKDQQDRAWGRFVSDMVAHWHRSGYLLAVERAWGLPESAFLRRQHEQWSRLDADGKPVCRRGSDGEFPPRCLNQAITRGLAGEAAKGGLAAFLVDDLGLDLSPLYDSFDRARLLRGIGTTVLLSLVAIIGSVASGIAFALILKSGGPVARAPVWALTTVARMTPPILQLYILFFGLGGLLASGYGLTLSGFVVASVVFSLYAGSANAVVLATALDHMGEAGEGRTPWQQVLHAIDRAYEGLVANCVNIVKAAGLASTIAVPEIISATNGIITQRGNDFAMMNLLLIFYFVFVLLVMGLLKHFKGWVARWSRS